MAKRKTTIVLGALLAIIVGLVAVLAYLPAKLRERARAADRAAAGEQWVKRKVDVIGRYELAWRARGDAPALKLSIPEADLGAWAVAEHPRLDETADGPREMRLFVPVAGIAVPIGVGIASLTLYRDPPREAPALANAGRFWISRRGTLASFNQLECDQADAKPLDLQCRTEPSFLARKLPRVMGREEVAVGFDTSDRQRCQIVFDFRGRPAHIDTAAACDSDLARRAFREGWDVLARLDSDTATPSVGQQISQARTAAGRCQRASIAIATGRGRNAATHEDYRAAAAVCGYAVQFAYPLLAPEPYQAADVMLEAMVDNVTRQTRWDRAYLGDIVRALERAGKSTSKPAIQAHALRVRLPNPEKDPALAAEKRESLEVLLAGAPGLHPQDRLLPTVDDAMRTVADDNQEARLKRVALVEDWHVRAQKDGDSQTRILTQIRVCEARLRARDRLETLDRCGDAVLADWQRYAATGLAFTGVGLREETELVFLVPYLYSAYAHATGDFARGAAGVRSVGDFAATRFQGSQYTPLLDRIRELGDELAQKAAPKRR